MDFVVSKVSMSILALMTATVLYGIYGGDLMTDAEGDLKMILARFSDETVAPAAEGAESTISWEVPALPGGGTVWGVVGGDIVEAHSGSDSAVLQLPVEVHTWARAAIVLNSTMLESIDAASPSLRACTGQHLTVSSAFVMLDSSLSLMLFAEAGP